MKIAYLSVPEGVSIGEAVKNIEPRLSDALGDGLAIVMEPDHEVKELKRLLRLLSDGRIDLVFLSFGKDPFNIKENLFTEGGDVILPQ